ncbi:MAG: glutaredoxin 3 [Thioalkalivibrionaceae bacterium]
MSDAVAEPTRIEMYATRHCPYCVMARRLLDSRGLSWAEVRVDHDPTARAIMEERSGRTSVPQIFLDGRHVGGYTDLLALSRSGELDAWLAQAPP